MTFACFYYTVRYTSKLCTLGRVILETHLATRDT